MDSGRIEIFRRLSRVQHNVARGPAKGWYSLFHLNVTLDEVPRLAANG